MAFSVRWTLSFSFLVRRQVVAGTPSVLCMAMALLNKAFGALYGHHRSIFSLCTVFLRWSCPMHQGTWNLDLYFKTLVVFFSPLGFTCRNLCLQLHAFLFRPARYFHASPKSKNMHQGYKTVEGK